MGEHAVDILYFEGGSGHRSAARALERAIADARPGLRARMLDIVDVFDEHPRMGPVVRRGIRDFNDQLTREKVFDLRGRVNLGLLFHDLLREAGIRRIGRFFESRGTDAIVSVTPMWNPAVYRAARAVDPNVLAITIPVDCEEFKRRYWFTPRVEQHYLLGTRRLLDQARKRGLAERYLHPLSGMVVDPAFYEPPPADRDAELSALGLDPSLPTGVLSFGGQGSVVLERIVHALSSHRRPMNLIVLCGRNEAVRARIGAISTPGPKAALGYLPDTPVKHLQIADFVVGKPGVLTINEALVAQKPMVLVKARGMRPVQVGNERWATEQGIGVIAKDATAVPAAIDEVLSSPRYRERAAECTHRGVFDAVERIVALIDAQEGRSARPKGAVAR